MNNNNLSIRKTPIDSDILPYTYSLNFLLDMCILKKKYDNFIILVLYNKDSECAFSFNEIKKRRLLFFNEVSLDTILDETFMVTTIQSLCRKHKRFVIINLTVEINPKKNTAHANLIIIDTKKKEVYRFAPRGSREKHTKLDELLEKFFVKVNPKYKFIKIKEYLPYFFLQSQEVFLQKLGKKHKLDTVIGSCYYWCHYFLKLRLKFPDMDIKKLAEKCIHGIKDSKKTDMRRIIRNHAQNMEKLIKKEYPQLEEKFGPYREELWYNKEYHRECCKIYIKEFKY